MCGFTGFTGKIDNQKKIIEMMNEKIILSREQILNAVWGYSYEGDTRTVDTHIKQLRSKLISADYIKTVYKVGYKFECEED